MSNLDDFFKKRDKKKKSATKVNKFSTIDTEELAKNLEVATIQTEETDPDFQEKSERVTTSENQDEEWKPFDSEENKDYTGLRINTNTWKDEDEFSEIQGVVDDNLAKPNCPWGAGKGASKSQDDDEDDEDVSYDTSNNEPVSTEPKTIAAVIAENNAASAAAESKAEPSAPAPTPGAYIPPSMRARMAAEAAPKPAAPAPSSSGGAYVPPSMRGRMGESSSGSSDIPTSSVNYRRPNKAQPNLNDCLEFPSLDAMGPGGADKNATPDDRFEYAKKSGRVEPKNEKDSQINLQNKFATLTNQ